jgi:hypothetical protein
MTLSKKLLTIAIAVSSVIGLIFVVSDNSKESNDRGSLRSSDVDISESPTLPGITKTKNQRSDKIEALNQEIMILKQNQRQLLERVGGLVAMIQEFDERNSQVLVGQAGIAEIDDTVNNPYYPRDDEVALARIEHYETNLATQHIDSNWGNQVYVEIESMLQDQTFMDSSIVSMDCRETLCMLDMMHVNEEAMDSFLGEFPHRMAWNNDSFVKTEGQGDEGFRTMMYFSRDGHSLPGGDQTQNGF